MIGLQQILLPLADMGAVDRFNAVQSRLAGTAPALNPWQVAFVTLLAIVACAAGVLIYRHIMEIKQGSGPFVKECYRLGLTPEERDVLRLIAELSGMKHAETIFTMDVAFGEGATALLNSKRVVALSEQGRLYVGSLVDSLREKLGFQPSADENTITTTKKLPKGAEVFLERRGDPEGCDALLADVLQTELVIKPVEPRSASADDVWVVRYAQAGSIWEFDLRGGELRPDGTIAFGHSESVRFINRRRFPRVETVREAMIAAFPFHGASLGPPQFVAGTLTELAGPGIRVESSLALEVGDRGIVLVKLKNGRVVQGVARVRRANKVAGGKWALVMEFNGLTQGEVSELSRETNLASQEATVRSTGSEAQEQLQEA